MRSRASASTSAISASSSTTRIAFAPIGGRVGGTAGGGGDPGGGGRAAHRVMRVRDEMDHDLGELMGVGPEDGKLLRQVEDDLDVVGPQLVGEQLDRLSNHLIEGHLMTLRRL